MLIIEAVNANSMRATTLLLFLALICEFILENASLVTASYHCLFISP